MSEASVDRSANLEPLSAFVDGELDAADVAPLCGAWRRDEDLRSRWHAYQLIGDVLRSEDLATPAARDQAFLSALRARLDTEPVVLAPAATGASGTLRRRRWGWGAPAAVAAGFVAVAGTTIVLQQQRPSDAAAGVAAAPSVATEPVRAAAPLPITPASATIVASSIEPAAEALTLNQLTMIRDARLDRYLAAHKQFAGSSALAAPSLYLRADTVRGTAR